MTDDEILGCADENYFHAFRLVAKCATRGDLYEDDEILLTSTGTAVEWLNIAFLKQPAADPLWAVQHAIDFYKRCGVPFVLRIRDGLDAAAEEAAEALGLGYTDSVPGMVMAPIASGPAQAEGLEIRTVENSQTLADFARIIAASFHLDLDVTQELLSPRLLEQEGLRFYLGCVDGAPVATSSLLLTPRTAGVHYVATLDSHRKRGIGDAMTRHAVNEGAAAGAEIASLQASDIGKSVYERMGFRVTCEYRTFHNPAFLEG
jgi:GNAT superfamily N-acetyltransferase